MLVEYRPENFSVDGSLRDVCVLDAHPEDWSRMLSELPSSGWEVFFSTTIPDGDELIHAGAEPLFRALESHSEESATLSIRVGGIWFSCYFFDTSEIEFTFDPSHAVDENSFRAVEMFMVWLGDACDRRVIMTMESTDHQDIPALLEYLPS